MTLLEPHYIHQTCDILDGLLSMFPDDVGKYRWVLDVIIHIILNKYYYCIIQFNRYISKNIITVIYICDHVEYRCRVRIRQQIITGRVYLKRSDRES